MHMDTFVIVRVLAGALSLSLGPMLSTPLEGQQLRERFRAGSPSVVVRGTVERSPTRMHHGCTTEAPPPHRGWGQGCSCRWTGESRPRRMWFRRPTGWPSCRATHPASLRRVSEPSRSRWRKLLSDCELR